MENSPSCIPFVSRSGFHRGSIERQINLDNLSEEELKGLFTERNKVGRTTSELFTRQKQGRGHKVLRLAGRKKATKKEDGEGVQNGVKEE